MNNNSGNFSVENSSTTLMYAINDTSNGHNIPSLPMGQTEEGQAIVAKAIFADKDGAQLMATFMDKQANQEGRFEVVIVEAWRPTDIEVYVRDRIREANETKGPKIILPGA